MREKNSLTSTIGLFLCVKSGWFLSWMKRFFLRRAKKIHLWGSKWNFLTYMDLFIYLLDEKFVVNEGQNQGCGLTHGLFMLAGSKRRFVIWMTISFLEVHKLIFCKWSFLIHVNFFLKRMNFFCN